MILGNSDEAEDKERRYLRVLEDQHVRGILITPVHGSAPAVKGIRDRGTPVVLLDRPGPPVHCPVAVDDRRGGQLAVAHLLALGHRRIAVVNGAAGDGRFVLIPEIITRASSQPAASPWPSQ